jgi:hypothetical protein
LRKRPGLGAAAPAETEKKVLGFVHVVILFVSVLLLAFEAIYAFDPGRAAIVGEAILGVLGYVAGVKAKSRAVVWALVVISVICLFAAIIWKNAEADTPALAATVYVQPSLDWSGPLDIGQSGVLTVPLRPGYAHASIQFDVQNANEAGPICPPDTQLDLAAGPANDLRTVGTLKPENWSTSIDLAGFSASVSIQVTVETILTGQQTSCPVKITVPPVVLERG